jgi:hypothetical protein
MTTDGNFRVVDVRPNGAAASAGVQIGDVLLDLTWIPSDAPMYVPEQSDVLYADANGFLLDPFGNPLVDATGRRLTTDDIIVPAPGLEPGASEDVAAPEGVATPRPPVVPPVSPLVPPGGVSYTRSAGPPAEDYIAKDTVPFTAENAIRIKSSLVGYGVPLKLRVQRGDQLLELTITPMPPQHLPSEIASGVWPLPTPTSIGPGNYKF